MRIDHGGGRSIESIAVPILSVQGLFAAHLLERYALLPELPEMMAALGDTPPALGIPTLIAEIWRLLRQRKELAGVISREIQSSAECGKRFA